IAVEVAGTAHLIERLEHDLEKRICGDRRKRLNTRRAGGDDVERLEHLARRERRRRADYGAEVAARAFERTDRRSDRCVGRGGGGNRNVIRNLCGERMACGRERKQGKGKQEQAL